MKTEIERIIAISNEFFKLNDIEINGKKSELIVLNKKRNTKEKEGSDVIEMDLDKVQVKRQSYKETVRYLGIWLSEKGGNECNINIAKREILEIARTIRNKKMSLNQIKYIINRVLIPRVEFRLQTSFLSYQTCLKLQSPILMIIKYKLGFSATAANCIIEHKGLFDFRSIWQTQIAHHLTELQMRLNDS